MARNRLNGRKVQMLDSNQPSKIAVVMPSDWSVVARQAQCHRNLSSMRIPICNQRTKPGNIGPNLSHLILVGCLLP